MKPIVCNTSEIEQIKKAGDEPFYLIRPLREQPPEGYVLIAVDPILIFYKFLSDGESEYKEIKLPYAQGDELVVKETWRINPISFDRAINDYTTLDVEYGDGEKARLTVPGIWNNPRHRKRMPASTLPRGLFSRYALKVVGEPIIKRVQDMTIEEMGVLNHQLIMKCQEQSKKLQFKHYWNSRWKKYPWESNPYAILFKAVRSE